MTLEQLRIFVAVAEREHVTQASRYLGLTQSAVSAAIASLEQRFDIHLFDRVGRRISLTETGRVFLTEAQAVLARADTAETVLADLAQLRRGTLTLAGSQTIANYWLPPIMNAFRRRHSGIVLRLSIANTEKVAAWSREGVIDLGFIEGEISDPMLQISQVAEDRLVVVCTPELAPDMAAFVPKDLRALSWVFREHGSGTRSQFESFMIASDLYPPDLRIALELPSNEAVRSAVLAGAGATAISHLVVADDLRRGALVQLPVSLGKRRFLVLQHRERYATRAQSAFLALIGET